MSTEAHTQAADPATPAPNVGLELREVTLRLGDGDDTVLALDAVNLSVAPGELAAIVGPSGSGKSSLLAIAGGLATPTSGSAIVAGEDLSAASKRRRTELRRQMIGFVFQSGNLLPSLTALEQLQLPAKMGATSGTPRDPRKLLEEVGIGHKADRRPHQLSGGERQRVGIARALVTGPKVLLVDEPTAALDRERSHDIVKLLARETRESGVATVMVTHDHDVLQYCDSIYEMIDGRLTPASN